MTLECDLLPDKTLTYIHLLTGLEYVQPNDDPQTANAPEPQTINRFFAKKTPSQTLINQRRKEMLEIKQKPMAMYDSSVSEALMSGKSESDQQDASESDETSSTNGASAHGKVAMKTLHKSHHDTTYIYQKSERNLRPSKYYNRFQFSAMREKKQRRKERRKALRKMGKGRNDKRKGKKKGKRAQKQRGKRDVWEMNVEKEMFDSGPCPLGFMPDSENSTNCIGEYSCP